MCSVKSVILIGLVSHCFGFRCAWGKVLCHTVDRELAETKASQRCLNGLDEPKVRSGVRKIACPAYAMQVRGSDKAMVVLCFRIAWSCRQWHGYDASGPSARGCKGLLRAGDGDLCLVEESIGCVGGPTATHALSVPKRWLFTEKQISLCPSLSRFALWGRSAWVRYDSQGQP